MKNLSNFSRFVLENFGNSKFIVYHGARTPHDFSDTGYISKGTFFSEDIEVAESFGNFIYEVELKNTIKLFDSTSDDYVNMLLDEFDELYDMPYDTDNRELLTSVEQIADSSDTWEIMENNDGVVEWVIDSGYDGMKLTEGGNITYLLFNPLSCIKRYSVIDIISD